ncbi:hypothetical protein GCM10007962_04270 [Yeosuana aromativorans]|uniref:Alginate export domain-containing protein n=1 Tax=Yeosuana aromativorans TaxID=288019 RepID=A0A8J3FDI8_9FLAO|nr:hypothetical protein [Yeosuana aromativorans]GGK13010.1 hypothetical protein GCM10007962_04270 [Yeosuana aromativorans]
MSKLSTFIYIALFSCVLHSQTVSENTVTTQQDTIKKSEFIKQLGNGYFPTKYFNFDLRYLIKYNQYEALRTGLGGITNDAFSDKLRLNTYVVYGFRDHRFKYSFGTGLRLDEKTSTWIHASYTDDLQESGSSAFLTDKRIFQFFEPRLLNISLFHKHTTRAVSIEHQLSPKLQTETQLAFSYIVPTYDYEFVVNGASYTTFHISTFKTCMQWSPFSGFELSDNRYVETKNGYPKLTLQYTKSIKNLGKGDFNFSKLDFRLIQEFDYHNDSKSEITLVSGITSGETPLTHLYHAYPNNINKETIMQRFSVAGINSFETMYFNEFFSDKFTTMQFKHFFKPFNISACFKPQLVLISRYAIGDISHIERHQNVTFKSLKHGYTESGFEINKLIFGFGTSLTYRYGAYHLPNFGDNVAFKFTFNVTL